MSTAVKCLEIYNYNASYDDEYINHYIKIPLNKGLQNTINSLDKEVKYPKQYEDCRRFGYLCQYTLGNQFSQIKKELSTINVWIDAHRNNFLLQTRVILDNIEVFITYIDNKEEKRIRLNDIVEFIEMNTEDISHIQSKEFRQYRGCVVEGLRNVDKLLMNVEKIPLRPNYKFIDISILGKYEEKDIKIFLEDISNSSI